MAQPTNEYRLPLPEFLSSRNPSDLGDRSNTRYEHVPLNEEADHEPAQQQPVGLGITRPSATDPTHSRSQSYDTTNTLSPPDRTFSRSATSETNLLDEHAHPVRCPTKKTIVQRRLSWVPATILVLALYSTLFSGLYLAVACWKPRYGRFIGVDGNLAASTASLLSTLFAKTIELAYVTVCVAFLGQVLTRRAITQGSRGISIADMSMRTWIMQPGSLLVHWESLHYSGWTILGAITLTATLVAMLYTTAAEALVTPKLKMGSTNNRVLVADVYTSFANSEYLRNNCETSISIDADPEYRNSTCLNMQHAGQAYHNYNAFLQQWSLTTEGKLPSSTELGSRPHPTGAVYDNTTVAGSWIDKADMSELWHRYGRIVHNVTAAMPHGGIIAAANHPKNKITQPKDQSGEGVYEMEASVPSPAVNVLCAGMNATELAPIVYTEWPNSAELDPVTWTTHPPADVPNIELWATANRTVVDNIFGFGPDYPGQYSPIFGKLPKPYNTIVNVTVPYSNDAIYFLGASPPKTDPPYFLCSLRAKQSPLCTTRYKVAASGSHLSTACEENHSLQYNLRNPDVLDGVWEKDWKSIASEWAFTLSLNTGITDGASSNARLLMEFVPTSASLDPHLPSISEALAVMAGNTLLLSTQNAPLVPFWNESTETTILSTPATQVFNATLRSVEYASGGTQRWQGIFYPILIFAFITSLLCLAFMLLEVRGRQITDFTEPQNLFALAINSPATEKLQGACGAGPDGKQLGERFFVAMEEHDEHYYIRTKSGMAGGERDSFVKPDVVVEMEVEEPGTGGAKDGDGDGESPAMREYRNLATRKSWLSGFY
ncbi:hypothetical protein BJX70DRAFT_381847 [Aspergillus crustosus]